jgi:hypothetical protein
MREREKFVVKRKDSWKEFKKDFTEKKENKQ